MESDDLNCMASLKFQWLFHYYSRDGIIGHKDGVCYSEMIHDFYENVFTCSEVINRDQTHTEYMTLIKTCISL
jgi:hypothetical protein